MIILSPQVSLSIAEIDLTAIRSQGPGGQNVNKVSTAIHLRFDITKSSLPEFYKNKLLQLCDYRITRDGIIVIKAQRFNSQELNKEDAINRLVLLIKQSMVVTKRRISTKPSRQSVRKRLESKTHRSSIKKFRGKTNSDE
jgi:ribosome-associated protein